MRLLLIGFLACPLFSFAQDIPTKELFNQFHHRNDTAFITKEWGKLGFPDADYDYGSMKEFNALGDSYDNGATIKEYVGIYLDFAEDIHSFNNKKIYYRTGSKDKYKNWQKDLEGLGFTLKSWYNSDTTEGFIYRKGAITATRAAYYKGFKMYHLVKKGVYGQSTAFDKIDIGYVLSFEVQPTLSTDEVFELFDKRKDTNYIIKILRDHGFTEHKIQDRMVSVLGYLNPSMKYYSESYTVFLKPNDNLICYKTGLKQSFDSWPKDLQAKGFAPSSVPEEMIAAFKKGNTEALIKKENFNDGSTIYVLYLRQNG